MPTDINSIGQDDSDKRWLTPDERVELARAKVKKIIEHPPIVPQPEKKSDAALIRVLKGVPFLANTLSAVDTTGASLGQLAESLGNTATSVKAATNSFQYLAVSLSFLNFIRIPLIFLASYLIGEKPPLTLSKFAQWTYAAVLLGLGIAALAAPVAAPFILAAASVVVAGVSLFTLGRFIYQARQQRQSVNMLTNKIDAAEKDLQEIVKQIKKAENELTNPNNQEAVNNITVLSMQFQEKKDELQVQLNERERLRTKLNKKDGYAVADRGVGMALAAIGLVGAVLALFLPPVGLAIIVGSALVGLAYTGIRIAPTIWKFGKGLLAKWTKKEDSSAPDDNNDKPAPANEDKRLASAEKSLQLEDRTQKQDSEGLAKVDSLHRHHPLDSTAQALMELDGFAPEHLKESRQDKEKLEHWEHGLEVCTLTHNKEGVLKLFAWLAEQNLSESDVLFYLENESFEKSIPLLNAGIDAAAHNELKLSDDVIELFRVPSIEKILLESHVNLLPLAAAVSVSNGDSSISSIKTFDSKDEEEAEGEGERFPH